MNKLIFFLFVTLLIKVEPIQSTAYISEIVNNTNSSIEVQGISPDPQIKIVSITSLNTSQKIQPPTSRYKRTIKIPPKTCCKLINLDIPYNKNGGDDLRIYSNNIYFKFQVPYRSCSHQPKAFLGIRQRGDFLSTLCDSSGSGPGIKKINIEGEDIMIKWASNSNEILRDNSYYSVEINQLHPGRSIYRWRRGPIANDKYALYRPLGAIEIIIKKDKHPENDFDWPSQRPKAFISRFSPGNKNRGESTVSVRFESIAKEEHFEKYLTFFKSDKLLKRVANISLGTDKDGYRVISLVIYSHITRDEFQVLVDNANKKIADGYLKSRPF